MSYTPMSMRGEEACRCRGFRGAFVASRRTLAAATGFSSGAKSTSAIVTEDDTSVEGTTGTVSCLRDCV